MDKKSGEIDQHGKQETAFHGGQGIASEEAPDEMQMPVRSRAKRIAAMVGVVVLVIMVLATLVAACLDFDGSRQLFMTLMLCDIAVPVFLWFILHFLS